jgi:hypothetical protein
LAADPTIDVLNVLRLTTKEARCTQRAYLALGPGCSSWQLRAGGCLNDIHVDRAVVSLGTVRPRKCGVCGEVKRSYVVVRTLFDDKHLTLAPHSGDRTTPTLDWAALAAGRCRRHGPIGLSLRSTYYAIRRSRSYYLRWRPAPTPKAYLGATERRPQAYYGLISLLFRAMRTGLTEDDGTFFRTVVCCW